MTRLLIGVVGGCVLIYVAAQIAAWVVGRRERQQKLRQISRKWL